MALTFNNGLTMPQVGLGTWQSKTGESAEVVKKAVASAIDAGYRLIDCAHAYGNEKEIGEVLHAKIADGTVKREELFITSKLWCTFHRKEMVAKSIDLCLERFGLDYIDLYLVHWPMAFQEGEQLFPFDKDGQMIASDVPYVDTWKAMEDLVDTGKVKSIGLSNFNIKQIQEVLDVARIKPVCLQIECSPYLSQKNLQAFCEKNGIIITAFFSLGSPERSWAKPDEPKLLEDPKVLAIAERLERSPGQVLLRWAVQQGIAVIPKSSNEGRIKSNHQLFDFSLTDDDMKVLMSFDGNHHRGCPFAIASQHPDYPFKNDL